MQKLEAKHMMRLGWHAQSIKDDKVHSEAYRRNNSMHAMTVDAQNPAVCHVSHTKS